MARLRAVATIGELEAQVWPEPGADATHVVRRCWALRTKELAKFTIEDLRIMLGQQVAVPILLPRAVRVLIETPLAEGDYYPGDLLHAVMRLPAESWQGLSALRTQLAETLALLAEYNGLDDLQPAVSAFVAANQTSTP